MATSVVALELTVYVAVQQLPEPWLVSSIGLLWSTPVHDEATAPTAAPSFAVKLMVAVAVPLGGSTRYHISAGLLLPLEVVALFTARVRFILS